MPVYEYEHSGEGCPSRGKAFEVEQNINAESLSVCPSCGSPVKRLIPLVHVSTPVTDSKYKEMGFTKLVRRDEGVYENVTGTDGQSRYVERDKPETLKGLTDNIAD